MLVKDCCLFYILYKKGYFCVLLDNFNTEFSQSDIG